MTNYLNYTASGKQLVEAGVDPRTLLQVAKWIYDNEGLCGDLPDTNGMEWFAEALRKAVSRIDQESHHQETEVATTDGKPFDEISHARHYNRHPSGVECIEIMERLGANLGTAFKYLWRRNDKESPVKDLNKALFYLRRELSFKWESLLGTSRRLDRVTPHETLAIAEAMNNIFAAAASEIGSSSFTTAIADAIRFVQTEIDRLEALEKK